MPATTNILGKHIGQDVVATVRIGQRLFCRHSGVLTIQQEMIPKDKPCYCITRSDNLLLFKPDEIASVSGNLINLELHQT